MKILRGILLCIVVIIICFLQSIQSLCYDENNKEIRLQIGNKNIWVNGISKELDAAPVIVDSTTLVPIRIIVEELGGQVEWDDFVKKTTVKLEDRAISLLINEKSYEAFLRNKAINGRLDVPPTIINGRTFIPLRLVTERLGYSVNWNDTSKEITICRKPVKSIEVIKELDGNSKTAYFQELRNENYFYYNNEYFKIDGTRLFKSNFLNIFDCIEGLAFYATMDENKNYKYGLIDTKGNVIVKEKFEGFRYFNEGMACVKINNKWGFINNKGQLVIDCVYDNNSSWPILSYAFHGGAAIVRLNNKYLVIDKSGNVINKVDGEISKIQPDANGFVYFKKDSLTGVMDRWGKVIIEPKYKNNIDCYSEGTFRINKTEISNHIAEWPKEKYGFIDFSGRVICEPQYDEVAAFSDGMARVQLDNKCGYINKKGEVVIDLKYTDGTSFYNGVAYVEGAYMDKEGRMHNGYIDKNGKIIAYTFFGTDFENVHDGYFIRIFDGELLPKIYDYKGNLISDKFKELGIMSQNLVAVKVKDKWGFADKNLKIIIEPQFEQVKEFHENYAPVKQNGLWGYINIKGDKVIDYQYYDAFAFFNGVAKVVKNEKDIVRFFINTSNNVLISYDELNMQIVPDRASFDQTTNIREDEYFISDYIISRSNNRTKVNINKIVR